MAILEEPIKETLMVKNHVDGKRVESTGEKVDVVNPATKKIIGTVPISTVDELNAAVEAAKTAFPDWRRTTLLVRSRMLFRLKTLLEENFEMLSRVQTMEHGRTIDESRGETRERH